MRGEPVRGGLPEAGFYSLSGIEQAQALRRGLIPRPPLAHLMGLAVTQVSPGATTMTLPSSPWLDAGGLDVMVLGEAALSAAVLAGAPSGADVRTASLSVTQFRRVSLDAHNLIAHARTITSAPNFTFAEVAIEDALGRAAARVTGAVLIQPRDPPPPIASPLGLVDEATYPTPDPYLRPLPAGVRPVPAEYPEQLDGLTLIRKLAGTERAPLFVLFEAFGTEVEEGRVVVTAAASEWFCYRSREVSPGVLAALAYFAASCATHTLTSPGFRIGVLDMSFSLLRPVVPDGRPLVSEARVTDRQDDLVMTSGAVTDADGQRLASIHQTALLLPVRSRPPRLAEPMLLTVLFTDLVGSTARARELGDERWQLLLGEHQAVVRRQLEAFRGREVKTTGDGFLATFDSPARAVRCASAIRADVEHLGLEVRAGIHTGECEVVKGDVAGIAVHLAARVLGAAAAREILVSGTVRDLLLGSGLRFDDRGRHKLKGIDGEWQLFALEE